MSSPAKPRLIGVDLARGIALLGMFSAHIFTALYADGSPSLVTMVTSGRSATLFAFLAGVSLAFVSGRREPVTGNERTFVRASLVGRAVVVGLIGLVVGVINEVGDVDVAIILVFYAAAFLLAIPFLGLRTKPLLMIAAVLAVVGPVVRFVLDQSLPGGIDGGVPEVGDILDPFGVFITLTVEGTYPLTAMMVFILTGLAVGRSSFASVRVAKRMVLAGVAAALTAWTVATVLLVPLGGLGKLGDVAPQGYTGAAAREATLWMPQDVSDSWWGLAQRAAHTSSTFDVVHTLGCAVALLGLLMLATRNQTFVRLTRPVAAAGSMPLTLYSLHIVFLATGLFDGTDLLQYIVLVVLTLVFGTAWQKAFGRGPLERLTGWVAAIVRSLAEGVVKGRSERSTKASA